MWFLQTLLLRITTIDRVLFREFSLSHPALSSGGQGDSPWLGPLGPLHFRGLLPVWDLFPYLGHFVGHLLSFPSVCTDLPGSPLLKGSLSWIPKNPYTWVPKNPLYLGEVPHCVFLGRCVAPPCSFVLPGAWCLLYSAGGWVVNPPLC